jgi:S-adenosylmethionine-diacylgycerolhomoserine-N-methlytransferase
LLAERAATWRDDLPVLWRMLRGKPRGGNAAEALDAFYAPQAEAYDRFRERLLAGRRELMQALPLAQGSRVLDLGAGTGGHWSYVDDRITEVAHLELVDLCEPLLDVAHRRFAGRSNVRVAFGDAQQYRSEQRFDIVLFSYSLSMMSDWRQALDTARRHLEPGGTLAVIDFYTLPGTLPAQTSIEPLSGWDRHFWPRWFRHDGVYLDPNLLPTLMRDMTTLRLTQERSRVPYLGGLRAPWFAWMGQ